MNLNSCLAWAKPALIVAVSPLVVWMVDHFNLNEAGLDVLSDFCRTVNGSIVDHDDLKLLDELGN